MAKKGDVFRPTYAQALKLAQKPKRKKSRPRESRRPGEKNAEKGEG